MPCGTKAGRRVGLVRIQVDSIVHRDLLTSGQIIFKLYVDKGHTFKSCGNAVKIKYRLILYMHNKENLKMIIEIWKGR